VLQDRRKFGAQILAQPQPHVVREPQHHQVIGEHTPHHPAGFAAQALCY
jgi:hypothetical protein